MRIKRNLKETAADPIREASVDDFEIDSASGEPYIRISEECLLHVSFETLQNLFAKGAERIWIFLPDAIVHAMSTEGSPKGLIDAVLLGSTETGRQIVVGIESLVRDYQNGLDVVLQGRVAFVSADSIEY